MGAHPFFRCAQQMERHKPLVQGNVRILEDRSDRDGELFAACATLPNTLAHVRLAILFGLEPIAAPDFAALGAVDFAIRPALLFEKCSSAIFVVIRLGYVVKVHWLSSNEPIISDQSGFVKYIIPHAFPANSLLSHSY